MRCCVAGGRPAARRGRAGPGRDGPGEDQPDGGPDRGDAGHLHPLRVHQREERVDRLLHRPARGHPRPPGEEAGQADQARKEGGHPGDPHPPRGQPDHRRRVRLHHLHPGPGRDGRLLHQLLLHRRPAPGEEGERDQEPGGRGRQAGGGHSRGRPARRPCAPPSPRPTW